MKSKALNIRKSVCDLDDVIRMVQASTEIQEKKIESLENLNQKTEEFTAENYNPREWARLAKKAGMKYAVLTAKHHDASAFSTPNLLTTIP